VQPALNDRYTKSETDLRIPAAGPRVTVNINGYGTRHRRVRERWKRPPILGLRHLRHSGALIR